MKKFIMIVGTEYPAPGLGNWNYAAAFVDEQTAKIAALGPCTVVYECTDEEDAALRLAQIKASLDFQLWANEVFHKPQGQCPS